MRAQYDWQPCVIINYKRKCFMKSYNKPFGILFVLLLLTLFSQTAIAARPIAPSNTFHLTGQVYYGNMEGGFYGIIGDDGVKYQPTNLPRKFRKEGLPLKFDGKIKDGIVSTLQWGTIVELSNVSEITTDIAVDERRAMYVLLKRMVAFNNKDLPQLQRIDTLSKQLTKEQFDSWVSKYTNYTLRYVDVFSADSSSITGACYYTRELVTGMTMNGNTDLAMMTFTMNHTTSGWKLTELGNLTNPIFNDKTDALADLNQKAMAKYKTDNLATLWQ